MKRYIIVAFALFSFGVINAQNKINDKSYYSFDRLESAKPWIVSKNGAGLTTYSGIENFSTANGYYSSVNGDYRDYNQAESISSFGLQTKSYSRWNDVFFYGLFKYENTTRNNQAWLGTNFENSHINPMLDSIPGKNLLESYEMAAKVAYKMSPKFSIGLSLDYLAATSAKRIDGRNRNTGSDFNVSPGVSYADGKFRLGLNLNYGFNSESVEYTYLGETVDKQLLYMEGLFMTSSTYISNTIVSERRYERNTYGGAIQAEFLSGNFSFYNNFTLNYFAENDYEDNLLKKRYAIVNSAEYDYTGILKYSTSKMENSLKIRFLDREDLSYSVSNIYEPIEGENNFYEYYEYGKSLRYAAHYREFGLEYNGFIKKSESISKIDYTLGYRNTNIRKEERIFPSLYTQDLSVIDVYASVNKNIFLNGGYFSINLQGGYSDGSGDPIYSENPLTTGSLQLNTGVLAHNYAYSVSTNYRVGAGLSYTYFVNKERGETLNIGVDYLYRELIDITSKVYDFMPDFEAFEKGNRNSIAISISYNF